MSEMATQAKSFYSKSEFQRIFTKRLDDEMFEKVGREVSGTTFGDDEEGCRAAIWKGYEHLIGYEPLGY